MDVNEVKKISMIMDPDIIVIGFFSSPHITVLVW